MQKSLQDLASVFEYQDYRQYLRDAYAQRCRQNTRYSLRGFARNLDVSPSWLSDILSGKKALSVQSAPQVSSRLGLGEDEADYFNHLVMSQDGRTTSVRSFGRARVLKYLARGTHQEMRADVFEAIANWYYFAILELAQNVDCQNNPAWIAKVLDITPVEAKNAIQRLIRLGLLHEAEGRLVKTEQRLSTTSDVPSTAIRMLHKQLIQKALSALTDSPIHKRDITANVMSVNAKHLPKIKERLKSFRREIADLAGSEAQNRDSVYCLNMQFFELRKDRP